MYKNNKYGRNLSDIWKLILVVSLLLGSMPMFANKTVAVSPYSITTTIQNEGIQSEYINDSDIPVANIGKVVDTLVDSVNTKHELTYRWTMGMSMRVGFSFLVKSDNVKNRDRYLTLVTFKDINNTLTPVDIQQVDTSINGKELPIMPIFYSSDFRGDQYAYFLLGVSNKKDAEFTDEILFKVKLTSFFFNSAVMEGSYVVYNNESTKADKASSTGFLFNKMKKHTNDKSLGLYAYQMDANIPFDAKGAKNYMIRKKFSESKVPYQVGNVRDFWVTNFKTEEDYQIKAKLSYTGSKVNVWVHDNEISADQAKQLGEEFDEKIYPSVVNNFGKESDVDGDGKINLLTFDIQDGFSGSGSFMGGYFNQNDTFNVSNSNQAEILYLDTYPALGENQNDFSNAYSTIAHEFQHLVNHNQNVLIEGDEDGMEVWLDEAMSMAAEQIYTGRNLTERIDYYNTSPSIADGHSLLHWEYDGDTLANYSLSYLFGQYVRIQARQGNAIFKEILQDPNNNYVAIEKIIRKYIDPSLSFGKFTTKFRVALLAKEQTGLLGFHGDPIAVPLKPRPYAGFSNSLRGGGAVVVKVDPIEGFFPPNPLGNNITYTVVSLNSIPASQIPINDLVIEPLGNLDEEVKGIGIRNSKIVVKLREKELGNGTADWEGKFSIKIPKQPIGTILVVSTTATSGRGMSKTIIVGDKTPPEKPFVDPFTNKSDTLFGQAEINSTVTVTIDNMEIASAKTNSSGNFAVLIGKQPVGTTLTVYVTDQFGNKGEAVTVKVEKAPPMIPNVSPLTDQDVVVKGEADPKSLIYVKSGTAIIGKGVAAENGEFEVTISRQLAGTELVIYAEDSMGQLSAEEIVVVTSIPPKPTVYEVGDHTRFIKGKITPGLTIYIEVDGELVGESISKNNGEFIVDIGKKLKMGTVVTVYSINEYYNKSEEVKVKVVDKTAPLLPSVTGVVNSKSTSVSGKSEAGSTVYIYNGSKILAKVVADKSGKFKSIIKVQKKGSKLSIFAKDKAGNKSGVKVIVVK